MIKYLLFLFISFNSLNADYLLKALQDNDAGLEYYCIKDYSFNLANKRLYFTTTEDDNYRIRFRDYADLIILDGYQYNNDTDSCESIPYKLGLKYYDYKFLIALVGLLFGFILIYLTSLLTVKIIKD